jgi:hypothetical protein
MSVIAEFYALIKGDSSQLQAELTKTKTALGGAKTDVGAFSAASIVAFAGVAAAASAVGKVILDLANETMNYGLQVHDMALITGDSVENTSMLIQAADDARISYEQLTTAMKIAVKQGIDPSLEGMMRLADQYNAIQDPIQRSQFLLETFGKSGLQMGKLLETGSSGIKASADQARQLGLVMNEQQVANAQNYYAAIDNLGDAFSGLKYNIGNGVIPALTAFANLVSMASSNIGPLISGFNGYNAAFAIANPKTAQFTKIMSDLLFPMKGAIDITGLAIDKFKELSPVLVELGVISPQAADAFNELSGAEKNNEEYTDSWTKTWGDIPPVFEAAVGVVIEMRSALDALNEIDPNFGDKIRDQLSKMKFAAAGGKEAQVLFDSVKKAMELGVMDPEKSKKPLQDILVFYDAIKISQGEMTMWEGMKDIRDQLGLKDLDAANKLLQDMLTKQGRLEDKTVTYTTILKTIYWESSPHISPFDPSSPFYSMDDDGATGGYRGYAGGGFLVGERGPEVVSASSKGYVAPNETATIRLDEGSMRSLSKYIVDGMAMARA